MAGVTIKLLNTSPITPVQPGELSPAELCLCDFVCEYTEKAFASSEDDEYKKDYSDFLFRKISPSDTIELSIQKNGNEVAIISDDTYGTYYPTFATQPLYVGLVLDWTKVFELHQGGNFNIVAKMTILGTEREFKSRRFYLNTFSEEDAIDTIKMVTVQNGNIISSEFDYTNLIDGGWKSYRRLRGNFGKFTGTLERDEYQDASRRVTQIQDKMINEYTLTLKRMSEKVLFNIFNENLLANEIYITDYNLIEISKEYINYAVVPEGSDGFNYSSNGLGDVQIKFRDRTQNSIKRNY